MEISQADEDGLFDAVLVNDSLEKTSQTFFRLMRDWYPALPSAARLRMLQRRIKHIKSLSKSNQIETDTAGKNNSINSQLEVVEGDDESVQPVVQSFS